MKPWIDQNSKRKDIEKIANNALTSLQEEFKQAADLASQDFIDKCIKSPLENERSIHRNTSSYNYTLNQMQFLFNGTNGAYQSVDDFSGVCMYDIWGDYLQSIKRLDHGSGCYPRNGRTIVQLIEQNGPKKMEKRLASYLKRRIAYARKQCATPNRF